MAKLGINHVLSLHLRGKRVEEVCADFLHKELPLFSHCYIDAALSGDLEACRSLSITDNCCRPLVLVCLYACCRDSDGFKEALSGIWGHDGPLVLREITSSLLVNIFRCGGKVSRELPKSVTVYRGGLGTIDQLRRGWSWTTERGVAAWFAERVAGEPLVIEAKVASARILHMSDARCEREIVMAGGVRRAAVSGTSDSWVTEARTWHRGTARGTLSPKPASGAGVSSTAQRSHQ